MFISMWLIPIVIVGGIIISSRKEKKRRDFNLKRKYLPKTAENIKLLEEAYEIFIETQIAWMSFDYDKLREVTTDELYNTYYNQLQPLKLKEQINVMHDFELVRYEVVEKINGTSGTTVKVELEVKFYDYISNSKGACIRGNQDRKVHMLYDLTYVYKENLILTFIGAIVGIFLGKALHLAIMVMVELDNVMFGRVIHWPSYIYSVVITILFAVIVNQVMKKRLRNIPMVESLKSVE